MKCKEVMNIAIAINDYYFKYAYVMLVSLFENVRDTKISIYLLYENLLQESITALMDIASDYGNELIPIIFNEDFIPSYFPTTKFWTKEIYFRLALQDILPEEVERILYLDSDVLINKDISDFYWTSFDDNSFIVQKDFVINHENLTDKQRKLFETCGNIGEFRYFNSGVLLLNISKLRKIVNFSVYLEAIQNLEEYLECFDQDLLNYLFFDDVKYVVSEEINFPARIFFERGRTLEWVRENAAIVHYTGYKPWDANTFRYDTELLWWEYAKKTPFYADMVEKVFWDEMRGSFAYSLMQKMTDENKKMSAMLLKISEMI